MNYLRCKYPEISLEVNKIQIKSNWTAIALILFSIAIHILLTVRIKLYKQKLQKSVQILQKSEQAKQNTLFEIDSKTIVNFSKTSFTMLICASSVVFLAAFVNRIDPNKMNEFPNNMIIFLYNCIIPCSTTSVLLLVYYIGNLTLWKSISREIQSH